MGHVNAIESAATVMPEVFVLRGSEVLMVHGHENGREFWWPPGAYWLVERACNLQEEQPVQWVQRVLSDQLGVSTVSTKLERVEFVAPHHPPVLVFSAEVIGEPLANGDKGFDDVRYFDVDALPTLLGRDDRHGSWLKQMLKNVTSIN